MSTNDSNDERDRFAFGDNWASFLSLLDESRIEASMASLQEYLQVDRLDGCRFLDIGSGSGLSSLAARRLGANVTSFDYDPQSVACTMELKRRYFRDDNQWKVERGSALDRKYLEGLGKFDIVYSWGVLHHTGAMWLGIENVIDRIGGEDGKLFIAIYNDQGWKSHFWWFIKLFYNRLPKFLRSIYVFLISTVTRLIVILKYTIKLQPMAAIGPLLRDRRERGMSGKHDMVDWVGGFPFEFAKLDVLVRYFSSRGFSVIKANENTSLGCHELSLRQEKCAG